MNKHSWLVWLDWGLKNIFGQDSQMFKTKGRFSGLWKSKCSLHTGMPTCQVCRSCAQGRHGGAVLRAGIGELCSWNALGSCAQGRNAGTVLRAFPHFCQLSLSAFHTPLQCSTCNSCVPGIFTFLFPMPSHPALSILGQRGGENC